MRRPIREKTLTLASIQKRKKKSAKKWSLVHSASSFSSYLALSKKRLSHHLLSASTSSLPWKEKEVSFIRCQAYTQFILGPLLAITVNLLQTPSRRTLPFADMETEV